MLYSLQVVEQDWQTVNWCQWVADHPNGKKRYETLYGFILGYFYCIPPPPPPPPPTPPPPPPEDPLAVTHRMTSPTRLTWDSAGKLYVTDAKVGSVFIYDANLQLTGELKGLDKPLGILVDESGRIYVGNDGRNNIEIYSPQGQKVATWGEGILAMPNTLSRDRDGNLYVADSSNDRISVLDSSGNLIRNIGQVELNFPSAVTVHYRVDAATGQEVAEVYVADQKNYLVRVYDLQGTLLRSFGGQGTTGGMMGNKFYWQGKFSQVSSLAFSSDGNLHALDSYFCNIQILNPLTGAYINYYGTRGTGYGQMLVPSDLAIKASGEIAVADTFNARVHLF